MTRRTVALSLAVATVWVSPVLATPAADTPPQPSTRSITVSDWHAPLEATSRTMAASGDDWSVSPVVDAGDTVLLGADWGGDDGARVQVRARDEDGWTDWMEFDTHAEHGPDTGSGEAADARSTASEPLWVGRVEELQFRQQGDVPRLGVDLVEIEGDLAYQPDDVPAGAVSAATETPWIRPRSYWGADESLRSSKVEYSDDVRFSVVHHVGGVPYHMGPDCEEAAAEINAIYEYHTQSKGYWDIAYNFVVDPCGRLWEGRHGGMDRAVQGAHAAGFNGGSVGVLALGTFQDNGGRSADEVTPELVDGIERLVAWKLDLHHTDPRGTTREVSGCSPSSCSSRYWEGVKVDVPILSAHQITNSTSCPGDDLMARLFSGTKATATPRTGYVSNVFRDGLPKAFDAQPDRWVASEKGDRPSWDVDFTEPVDWSLRITDADGELVRATGGNDESHAERTWDLRDADGELVEAGTYRAMLTGTGPTGDITPVETSLVVSPSVERHMGEDRVATSLALSEWAFDRASTVIVASSEAYPDALVSGPLAGSLGGPVLLTPRDLLPESVEAEIERLGADRVIVVGGQVAVSAAVEDELESDLDGVTVERIGGDDRFHTAALVAERVRAAVPSDEVLLSLGRHADERRAFPDALSAGAFGAELQLPVLLTNGDSLPSATRTALTDIAPSTVTMFGGTVAISDRVERQVTSVTDATVTRFAGETRYDTSRLAAEDLLERQGVPTRSEASADATPVDLIFASGGNWPDALGAGAAAAATGTVFLLAHPEDLDDGAATRTFLDDWDGRIGAASVAGGPVAIDGDVITAIAGYVTSGEVETEPVDWPADPHADDGTVEAIGDLLPGGTESPTPTETATATPVPTEPTTEEPTPLAAG